MAWVVAVVANLKASEAARSASLDGDGSRDATSHHLPLTFAQVLHLYVNKWLEIAVSGFYFLTWNYLTFKFSQPSPRISTDNKISRDKTSVFYGGS